MNRFFIAGVMALMSPFLLIGCGDKPDPKTQVATGSAISTVPAGYEATLAEGIDFKKVGYPRFLAEVTGMSGYEPPGRWTEFAAGPVAKFRFRQPLPRKFTLEIAADGFGPNAGVPIPVKVGGVAKTFTVTSFVVNKVNTYRLEFETDGLADTIEIAPPNPTSPNELDPKNGDKRKLGIFFYSLKIIS
jgi:phosphoglycerol transferase